ncbi:hypothetical protein ACA910_013612 [Epithemia clementina (nom. ined.)]
MPQRRNGQGKRLLFMLWVSLWLAVVLSFCAIEVLHGSKISHAIYENSLKATFKNGDTSSKNRRRETEEAKPYHTDFKPLLPRITDSGSYSNRTQSSDAAQGPPSILPQATKTIISPQSVFCGQPGSRIFTCGYDFLGGFQAIFPEFANVTERIELTQKIAKQHSRPNDVLVVGVGGFCGTLRSNRLIRSWFAKNFAGFTFHLNGENFGGEPWEGPARAPRRNFQIGYVADSAQSVRVYFAGYLIANMAPELRKRIFSHEHKQRNTMDRFMIYTTSNCVGYREGAVDLIASKVGVVDQGGSCWGLAHDRKLIRESPWAPIKGKENWMSNYNSYRRYRFCLVMENTKKGGYITEKIVVAFLSGCVPVYYGTEEVYDVFNRNSFVYYDIDNPQAAISTIANLEANRTAYESVLAQPILANGNKTIERFFSLSDGIGNGALKSKIRRMVCSQGS